MPLEMVANNDSASIEPLRKIFIIFGFILLIQTVLKPKNDIYKDVV